jgi:hypothetical protein
MRLLVIDDSLGNPIIVKQWLQDYGLAEAVEVLLSPLETDPCRGADVIILGGRWLGWAKELRSAFPLAQIIGRSPCSSEGPLEFFPWGDHLREPTLSLDSLLREYLTSQDRKNPG